MKGDITDKILQALKFGPMTVHEIAFETGLKTTQIHQAMNKITADAPRLGKRAYVKEWSRRRTANPMFEQHIYTAVYSLGSKPCAKKPRTPTNAEKLRISKQKRKLLASNNSIFSRSQAA